MSDSEIQKTAELASRAAGLAASAIAAQCQAGLLPEKLAPSIVEQLDELAAMLEKYGADGSEYREIARFVETVS